MFQTDASLRYLVSSGAGMAYQHPLIISNKISPSVLYERKGSEINQKQPSRCVVKKRCSENMQQSYRRTPMPKCDLQSMPKLQSNFIEIALWHGCSPVIFLHICRTLFPKNISGRPLLYWPISCQCLFVSIFHDNFCRILKTIRKKSGKLPIPETCSKLP